MERDADGAQQSIYMHRDPADPHVLRRIPKQVATTLLTEARAERRIDATIKLQRAWRKLLVARRRIDATIKLQRVWRKGLQLAMVGISIGRYECPTDPFPRVEGHVTFVRSRTPRGAEEIALETALPDLQDDARGPNGSVEFQGWVNEMRLGEWNQIC